ncbi:MAG: hypothetical protein R3324_02620, partial [Halobacteriales archaeon]|nr:hypothetical protein [Halobacteriales archaeon]
WEDQVGTGNLDPFLTIQNDNKSNPLGSEDGFNTDGTFNYDQKRSNFTDALPLNVIPVIRNDPDGLGYNFGDVGGLYREIVLDANESNSFPDANFSIDQFDLYLCDDPNANMYSLYEEFRGPDYPESPGTETCTRIYTLGNVWHKASDAATQGSGSDADYRILIPNGNFTGGLSALGQGDCPYNPEADPAECGVWVILDAAFGKQVDRDPKWEVGSTFEETSTVIRPWVTVEKSVLAEYTREYEWTITKTVDPASHTLLTGQSGSSDYDVVLDIASFSDYGFTVSGEIIITNPSDGDVQITDVSDVITGDGIDPLAANVTCPGEYPITLASGGTLTCTYTVASEDFDAAFTGSNNATVELFSGGVASVDSAFGFPSEPTDSVDENAYFTDQFDTEAETGSLGTAHVSDAPKTFEDFVSRDFPCSGDDYTKTNYARVYGADTDTEYAIDDATVTVDCANLSASKTANGTWERDWEWTIDKSANPTELALFTGETGSSDFDIVVTKSVESDTYWAQGTVTVTNPAPQSASNVTVEDCIEGSTDGGSTWTQIGQCVDLGPQSVPGNSGSTDFDYGPIELPAGFDPADYTDLRNYAEVSLGGTVETETTAALTFAANPDTEIDESADVSDSRSGVGPWTGLTAGQTISYSYDFTCDGDEGTQTNTATVTPNDDDAPSSDDASVEVSCYDVTAAKDVDIDLMTTYTWTVDKSVTPNSWDMFDGDDGTSEYTIEVTRSVDSEVYTASGDVTVTNNHPSAAATVTVEDCVQGSNDGGDTWTDLACETLVTGGSVAGGGSETYSYEQVFDPTEYAMLRNHATVDGPYDADDDAEAAITLPTSPTAEYGEDPEDGPQVAVRPAPEAPPSPGAPTGSPPESADGAPRRTPLELVLASPGGAVDESPPRTCRRGGHVPPPSPRPVGDRSRDRSG